MWKILGVIVLLVAAGCTESEVPLFEASMNFDSGNVQPFLERLNDRLGLNLPIRELVDFTLTTPVEEEKVRVLEVSFDGSRARLEYRVFMDDIDAPDLYFLTPSSELAASIDAQVMEYADELDR
jgi:hypothetical protein